MTKLEYEKTLNDLIEYEKTLITLEEELKYELLKKDINKKLSNQRRIVSCVFCL